jgi:RNA polymerase sigma-70 factor (ECF subfamily)
VRKSVAVDVEDQEARFRDILGKETEHVFFMSKTMAQPSAGELTGVQAAEADLVERCKEGDRLAFDELISTHQERVFNTAFRLMGNYEEALDLTQEVFLNCFRKIASFKGDSALSTWLYRITVNTAKNRWKYQQSRGFNKTHSLDAPLPADDEERVKQFPDPQPTPRKVASDREAMAFLECHLSALNEEHREVLVLYYFVDMPTSQMADGLEIAPGTVLSRLARARDALKGAMAPPVKTRWASHPVAAPGASVSLLRKA